MVCSGACRMSDPVRVALVAEGPTDRIVIDVVLRTILRDRSFVLTQLQPEGSVAFGTLGAGWPGVCRWCRQSANRGAGRLSCDHSLFLTHDLLIIHLDADVAGSCYEDGNLQRRPQEGALPCQRACPPAHDTTNALRGVLLSWCGEPRVFERIVFCMPSRSTETTPDSRSSSS